MSIKRKLTLTMMGVSLTAVALTVLPITAYLIYDMHRGKIRELAVTAAITADRNSAALIFLDNKRALDNLDVFHANPAIVVACLYDAKGGLFAAYRRESPGRQECPSKSGASLPDNILTQWKDIEKNGEKVGRVFIAADTSEIGAYVRKILFISGTVSLTVAAITLLLTIRFQQAISRPILELARTAQAITAHHDYTLEAPDGFTDETGTLARAFNSMICEVRKRDRELKQSNETLEIKVTERTSQLEEAKSRAEAANAAKSEFLRNMSHEFRTPLHALISFSAYGGKEYQSAPPEKLRDYFAIIQSSAERLSRLVDEVLDVARMEQGELRLLLARSDLNALAAAAAATVRPLCEQKRITLTLEAAEPALPAMCDQDKIVQVITNILGNAIKFTPEGGAIALSLEARMKGDACTAIICVRDEGIGIPEGEEELIFELFRQSSRTNTGAGGTGLGLAICRGIVARHGGRIWAENNKNAIGASVSFTLEALAQEAQNAETDRKGYGHEHAA